MDRAATTTQPTQPRRFASLFPPATHLTYASDMLRLREQRAAERASRQVRAGATR